MRYSIDMDGLALNFFHKRLLGAAKGFVTGGPGGAIGGFLTGGRPSVPRRLPGGGVRIPSTRSLTARPSQFSAAEKEAGRVAKFGGANGFAPRTRFQGTGGIGGFIGDIISGRGQPRARGIAECLPPLFRDVDGSCRFPTSPADISVDGAMQLGVGQAVMGRYGAALQPGNMTIQRAICLRGMQLGDDGLCYNKSNITNKQRMWPAGRKPLLTGGEMRAITVATGAGRRLERASKRLQKIGLMKKPAPRRKLISGPTEHHHHN